MKYNILIAEDDKDIAEILKLYLESTGYNILISTNGKEALNIIKEQKIDLAIFDINMPEINGLDLTKIVREKYNFPILILTAKISDADKITGLNCGADDYLTKPFNPLEVLARVNALLRRFYQFNNTNEENITIGELSLNTIEFKLTKNNKEIILTPIEYKILALLMKNSGRIYTKGQLSQIIGGEFYDSYDNSIMVHISHIREKIETDPKNPKYLKNVRGLGYKIEKAQ